MEYKNLVVKSNIIIKSALKILDVTAKQILFVVDDDNRLVGTLTDGDIRRGLLRELSLESSISEVINRSPKTAKVGADEAELLRIMQATTVKQLPIVDDNGHLIHVISLEDIIYRPKRDNIVVLMVGGLGTRLRPLTNDCPKPLLKVGKKPILETILDSFIEAGFHRFYLAVNYKSQMIEDYFGDGSRFGVEISYIHEKKRMGTAGALYFLPEQPTAPIVVMNGDLLTKVDFAALVNYHEKQKAVATMAVREYSYQVPYGVINFDGEKIVSIEEKPEQSFFVNAGIYVLSPEAVKRVNKEEFFDMPELFNEVIASGQKTTVYPIREYWLDIGRLDDFERAQTEYGDVF